MGAAVGGWMGGWGEGRAGNSGGTREPSSQKEFGPTESFFAFEIFIKLDSKKFLQNHLFCIENISFSDIPMISSAGIH